MTLNDVKTLHNSARSVAAILNKIHLLL